MKTELEWQCTVLLKDGRKAYVSARSLGAIIGALQRYRGNADTIKIERRTLMDEGGAAGAGRPAVPGSS